ncbi:MAG: DUF2019 domain-containing protein [Actinobacteria bacterium]|nr:DUF2019 domain-containing protein [Actinomycetota bacterium]
MEKKTSAELATEYGKTAQAWGRAMEASRPSRANAQFDELARLYRELKRRGRDALANLLPLLDDEEPYVRFAAAAWLLEAFPEEAVPCLERLSLLRSLVGVEAERTLGEWRSGRMTFPE